MRQITVIPGLMNAKEGGYSMFVRVSDGRTNSWSCWRLDSLEVVQVGRLTADPDFGHRLLLGRILEFL